RGPREGGRGAPRPARDGGALREDPHLQLCGRAGHRSPHQAHVTSAAGRARRRRAARRLRRPAPRRRARRPAVRGRGLTSMRPGVFIPRPETEVLVDVALELLDHAATPYVVDLCTGSGAVALAIADEHPRARVIATDVSEAAVALARENAERLGLAVDVRAGD